MTIQQLSKEIGIGIDTLRIWERRYGFPIPTRSPRGHRSYSGDQLTNCGLLKSCRALATDRGRFLP